MFIRSVIARLQETTAPESLEIKKFRKWYGVDAGKAKKLNPEKITFSFRFPGLRSPGFPSAGS